MKIQDLMEISVIAANNITNGTAILHVNNSSNLKLIPLPGGSNFHYNVIKNYLYTEISIFDTSIKDVKKSCIGTLHLKQVTLPFFKKCHEVELIYVRTNYRGQSIAKSLYGIALSILKYTLVSDKHQTKGAQRNWLSLFKIPNVEVLGILDVSDIDADSAMFDELISKVNAYHLGNKQGWHKGSREFFAFEVDEANEALKSKYVSKYVKLYNNSSFNTYLIARYLD